MEAAQTFVSAVRQLAPIHSRRDRLEAGESRNGLQHDRAHHTDPPWPIEQARRLPFHLREGGRYPPRRSRGGMSDEEAGLQGPRHQ
eukprot:scaffold170830_cov29-Tisochrysis_lutea.AAC.3